VTNGGGSVEAGGPYGPLGLTPGHFYSIVHRSLTDGGGPMRDYGIVSFVAADEATYKITFTIPPGSQPLGDKYQFVQNDVIVRSYASAAGDPQSLFQITGLTSNAPVIMQHIETETEYGEDPLNPGKYIALGQTVTGVAPVSSGTPTIAGATAPLPDGKAGPTGGVKTASPTAPSPTSAPSAPPKTPKPAEGEKPPNPEATGSGGATKEDTMLAANQVSDRIREMSASVRDAIHANVDATDTVAETVTAVGAKQIEATDKVAKAVSDNGKATVDALNKGQALWQKQDDKLGNISGKMTTLNSNVADLNSKFDLSNAKLDSIKTNTANTVTAINEVKDAIQAQQDTKEQAQTAATAANATAATQSAAAVTGIAALIPARPTTLGYSPDTSGNGDFFKIEMPSSMSKSGGITVDFNPFREDRMGPLASWMRQAMAWLVLCLLAYMVFNKTQETIQAASMAQQAKGNTIAAGTGGQATSLIAAGLMTAATVVLVTGIFSYAFGDITIPALISNLSANPLSTAPAHMIWVLDKVIPVATVLTAFIARISFPLYLQSLFAVYMTVVRWIVP